MAIINRLLKNDDENLIIDVGNMSATIYDKLSLDQQNKILSNLVKLFDTPETKRSNHEKGYKTITKIFTYLPAFTQSEIIDKWITLIKKNSHAAIGYISNIFQYLSPSLQFQILNLIFSSDYCLKDFCFYHSFMQSNHAIQDQIFDKFLLLILNDFKSEKIDRHLESIVSSLDYARSIAYASRIADATNNMTQLGSVLTGLSLLQTIKNNFEVENELTKQTKNDPTSIIMSYRKILR